MEDEDSSKDLPAVEEVRVAEVQHVAGFTFEAPPPPPAVSSTPLQAPVTITPKPSSASVRSSPAVVPSATDEPLAADAAVARSSLRTSVSPLPSIVQPTSAAARTVLEPVGAAAKLGAAAKTVGTAAKTVLGPVGAAAKTIFGVWFGAVGFGVSRALSLRSDWIEGQSARRKLTAVMRARAEERVAAKRREKQAMERLQELEQQIQVMQQQ